LAGWGGGIEHRGRALSLRRQRPSRRRPAYLALERQGLVEVRNRSGIYVAAGAGASSGLPAEPEPWLADVLVEGIQRSLSPGSLIAALQDATQRRSLRCVCVDGLEDDRLGLCREIESAFGMQARPVDPGDPDLASRVQAADVVVTTPFCSASVRAVLRPGQPLIVAGLSSAVERALRRLAGVHASALVCVQPECAARLLHGLGEAAKERPQVLTVEQVAAEPQLLERFEAVVGTRAAIDRLGSLLQPGQLDVLPCLSVPTLHRIARVVIRLNRAGTTE
jgi:hypothetical protein